MRSLSYQPISISIRVSSLLLTISQNKIKEKVCKLTITDVIVCKNQSDNLQSIDNTIYPRKHYVKGQTNAWIEQEMDSKILRVVKRVPAEQSLILRHAIN